MSDLLLDEITHDIKLTEYDLVIAQDDIQIAQNLKIRLLFFRGEWMLNTLVGLPFYDTILVKNPNIPNIDNIIKAEILDTPGVNQLLEYDSSFDSTLRKMTIDFTVDTDFGELEISEAIP